MNNGFRKHIRAAAALLCAALLLASTWTVGASEEMTAETAVQWEKSLINLSAKSGGAYPRFATLSDGTLLCVYRYGSYIELRSSKNEGKNWSEAVKVTPSIFADKSNPECYRMDVTNPEIIVLADDTILISMRVNKDLGDTYYSSIRVFASHDGGKTFAYHSTVCETTSKSGGLWEPYFKYIDHDKKPDTADVLAVYYCNSSVGIYPCTEDFAIHKGKKVTDIYPTFKAMTASVYQDVVMQIYDEKTGEWGDPIVAQNGQSHNSRDGMMVVTSLAGGGYAMTIESSSFRRGETVAPDGKYHRLVVKMSFSEDGVNWTTPVPIYIPEGYAPYKTGFSYAGAPYVVTLPDGRLAVSFHSNENYNSDYIVSYDGTQDSERYNCTMHVIVSKAPITMENYKDVGTESFTEAFEPITLTNGYSIWCALYVYQDKYLIAAASTGTNQSKTSRQSGPLRIRRALLSELPDETTTPAATTTAPVETTAKPVETTVKPVETTVKPVETTATPVETTAKPVETTVKPVETTVKPVETTVTPVETTVKPVETTVPPVVTTAAPVTDGGSASGTLLSAAIGAVIGLAAVAVFALLLNKKK